MLRDNGRQEKQERAPAVRPRVGVLQRQRRRHREDDGARVREQRPVVVVRARRCAASAMASAIADGIVHRTRIAVTGTRNDRLGEGFPTVRGLLLRVSPHASRRG